MHVLANYTPKLSCIGLLDFKTTKIHIPTIRKIHGKIHFAQLQWQFYKAVLSRNAGFMKLFYIGERYVVCSAFVYTPSPFLPASLQYWA